MKWFWTLIFCFGFVSVLPGQAAQTVPGTLILMFQPGFSAEKYCQFPIRISGQNSQLTYGRPLAKSMNIHLVYFDQNQIPGSRLLAYLEQEAQILFAQENRLIASRKTMIVPDDPLFAQQWAMNNTGQSGGTPDADIDAPEAWDISTGGLNPYGDSLVIAILDEGTDLNHSDLHIWVNHQEIPNDGMDNDSNGYVDDYNGWNALTSSGALVTSQHGTHVAGIAAADGNNNNGIAGVSWATKIMPVIATPGSEANAVEAYAYVRDMRKRYNESNGQEGAFIVATNSSFGINFGQASEYPIWCAMFDSLGAVGVLNVVSTANNGIDVDAAGDIPSTCQSDWMIAVTNTTNMDLRNGGSAFGTLSIDLGAPGTDILSTQNGGGYNSQTGTSMSAPMVTGALALMHGALCPAFLEVYRDNPGEGSLLLKKYILDGVDPVNNLQGMSVSGGRLNAANSLTLLQSICSTMDTNCLPPTRLWVNQITDTIATLNWEGTDSAASYMVRYREVGNANWTTASTADTFLQISSLIPCMPYEFEVAADCGMINSGFLFREQFMTEGCCEIPENLQSVMATDSSVLLSWDRVFGADPYTIQYRSIGAMQWESISLTDTFLLIENLEPCAPYEARVQGQCDSMSLGFSASVPFNSAGCRCTNEVYCPSMSSNAGFEWVAVVEVGEERVESGTDNGYILRNQSCFELIADSSYDVYLEPGYQSFAFREAWRIWIDLNRDGDFDDPNELIFDPQIAADSAISGTMHIPAQIVEGPSRMRVSMKFAGFSGLNLPDNCETYDFGEVEDFCVRLSIQNSSCAIPCVLNLQNFEVPDIGIHASWAGEGSGNSYELRFRQVGEMNWTSVFTDSTHLDLDSLTECREYEFQIRTICNGDTSEFGQIQSLETRCADPIEDWLPQKLRVYPNPAPDLLWIERNDQLQIRHIILQNLWGQQLKIPMEQQGFRWQLDLTKLPSAIYILHIYSNQGSFQVKILH